MSKKFLDQNGLTYLVSKLDDYPNNTILAAVIDGIDEVKQDKIVFNTPYNSTTNKVATMADINVLAALDPAKVQEVIDAVNGLEGYVDTHIAATGNPHGLTYSDIPNLTTKPLVITDNGTTTTYNILVVNN